MLEICVLGLFLLVRKDDGSLGCIAQAVITAIVTALTALFQITINRIIRPVAEYAPLMPPYSDQKTGLPTDDTAKDTQKASQGQCRTLARTTEDFDPCSIDPGTTITFEHDALKVKDPVIWIPRDAYGLSAQARKATADFDKTLHITDENANLEKGGKVTVARELLVRLMTDVSSQSIV